MEEAILRRRQSRKAYKIRHKEKVNLQRRKRRAEIRKLALESKRCMLCQFPFISKYAGFFRTRIYCNDCTNNRLDSVNRHRWKRYHKTARIKKKNDLKKAKIDGTMGKGGNRICNM